MDSDTPINDSIHTEHLIALLDKKRDQSFFANQQDSHEIIIVLLEMVTDIAESARALCYTLSPALDDFGGRRKFRDKKRIHFVVDQAPV